MDRYCILNDARSGILSLTVVSATEADIGQYECEVTTTHTHLGTPKHHHQ